jgi:hypothetical protein
MTARKEKVSTFEQLMKASQLSDKKFSDYQKADAKYKATVKSFPECNNKLFEFDGKRYVVTRYDTGWGQAKIEIIEIES